MRHRAFDTNYLIGAWRDPRPPADLTESRARARRFVRDMGTALNMTPVRIEFLCGATSARERVLLEAFLEQFEIADGGDVRPEAWREAERLAARVPRDGKPRQLGDCLIRAIASRLRLDVLTSDLGFPR